MLFLYFFICLPICLIDFINLPREPDFDLINSNICFVFIDFFFSVFYPLTSSFLDLFLYLAVSGLSCTTRASLVAVLGLSYPLECGILVPPPGIELEFPALEGEF